MHGGEVNAGSYTGAKANRKNHLAAAREARTMPIDACDLVLLRSI